MTIKPIKHALPELVNDFFDDFGELVSETVTTTLRDMVDAPQKLRLVRTNVDLGEVYLKAFTDDVRQEYNCRTCLQFLNGIGSIAYLSEDDQFIPLAFNAVLLEVVPPTFKASYEALLAVFKDARATDFEILTTDMVNEYGKFIGQYEAGGYHHFCVDAEVFGYAAVKDILIKHAVDLTTRANGVGKAEATAIHEYLLSTTKFDFPSLIAADKLRQRDQHLYAEMLDLFVRYRDGNRALIVLRALIDHGTMILSQRNTVVGALFGDIMQGVSFSDALVRYKSFVDPRFYKRPTRLPVEAEFESSVAFLTDKGYDKYLPVRFAALEEVLDEMDWLKASPEDDSSDVESKDIFAAARKKVVKETVEPQATLIEHPVEAISLRSLESVLKEYIEQGILTGMTLVARTAFTGAYTTTQEPDAGVIYADGKIVRKFYGSAPLPVSLNNDYYRINSLDVDGIVFEKDDFNNPMTTMLMKGATWKCSLPMLVFPDDLIGELQAHRRTIEHWSRSTPMNEDENGKVIVYDDIPLVMALSVGHGLVVKTKTEKFSFEITSLR